MSHRRLLLVAYHFPPIQGSTGTSRTVAFSKYLQDYGWEICVLTIQPRAYENVASENEIHLPPNVRVERAWGLDTRRSLSVFGKYPAFLALPDRWQSWILGGIVRGRRIVRNWRPDVVMTTYPIASAHVIGWYLNKKFKIPWVAEFRDPMLQPGYPAAKWERRAFAKIEELAFARADEIVVTTDGCRQMYLNRYPAFDETNVTTVTNGFDPDHFDGMSSPAAPIKRDSLILLHSGLLYPSERDPTAFFHAVRSLKDSGHLANINVEFHFRASGNEAEYVKIIDELGIDSHIRFLPRIPYVEAINEMRHVDALMIFQASNCNDQIPAKIYEYMYSQKPILALTDPVGDTGKLLARVGVQSIARLENSDEIKKQLLVFLSELQAGNPFVVSEKNALQYSRKSLTREIDRVLKRASCKA